MLQSGFVAVLSPQAWLFALLGVVVLTLWLRARHHSRPMLEVARRRGLAYHRAHSPWLLERFCGLRIFSRGHCHRAVDVLSAAGPRPTLVFRLIVEMGTRASRQVGHQVVVVVETRTPFRELFLGREQIDRWSPTAGTMIELLCNDAPPVFLQACDSDRARVPVPILRSWLQERRPGYCWQVTADYVAGHCRYRLQPEIIETLIDDTVGLVDLLERLAGAGHPSGATGSGTASADGRA